MGIAKVDITVTNFPPKTKIEYRTRLPKEKT